MPLMIETPYTYQLLKEIESSVEMALAEDLGTNFEAKDPRIDDLVKNTAALGIDVTAELIEADKVVTGKLITREDGIIAGIAWFNAVFAKLDPSIELHWNFKDGDKIQARDTLCSLKGNARNILTAERTAMNFLQTLSGTATVTNRYVQQLKGTHCKLLDTRKTIPMLRLAQKYAVHCGGGQNHRIGLYDAFLIKENHIASYGSIKGATETARSNHPDILVEVEVETFEQLDQALDAKADVIMLDNFSIEDMKTGVSINKAHNHTAKIEASGNVTLESLSTIAETGVDFISVGALTKHLIAIDLSLRLNF